MNNMTGYASYNNFTSAASPNNYPWYHGAVSRATAENLLSIGIDGCFLVRDSESRPGQYSVSVRHIGRVYHCPINTDYNRIYFIVQGCGFPTLLKLIDHHFFAPKGDVPNMHYPAWKNPPLYGMSHNSDGWQIDRLEIYRKQRLGEGHFGEVFEAIWNRRNKKVAVKTFRENITNKEEILKEAAVMKSIKHPNLVLLLGVCTLEEPFYIITEFMSKGNLLEYLRSCDKNTINGVVLLGMSVQVAMAMEYLEERNYIHRDLAARNCLVGENNLVKVADFGLSRLIVGDGYTARRDAKFPFRCTAPEGLAGMKLSTKSDVWSFGVLLWEIQTYGGLPYPDIHLRETMLKKLETGYRMEKPDSCPDDIHNLMLKCWLWEPTFRPTFAQILVSLENKFQVAQSNVSIPPVMTGPQASYTNMSFPDVCSSPLQWTTY